MLHRTFLTGLAVTLLVVQACGSSDRKKAIPRGDAGMGGEAGAVDGPDSGGSSAGSGTDNVGGEPGGSASTGGEAPSAGSGGDGGAPPSGPEPELLFTVKPGAIGLAGTALAEQTTPQNIIYSSKTAGQVKADGTNEVKLLGETLGLAEADQIVAFTLLQPEPLNPSYLFSMASSSQGGFATRVYQSWEAGDEEGDVYFSDGVASFRQLTEGGDQYGYNGLLAHESTLGLSSDIDSGVDDLGGLFVRDARAPLTEVYFTVPIGAVGVPDSAVATVLAEERPCTVFRSGLDGTNEVAFSCAQLGLVAYDRIDALLVYGDDTPNKLAFSVTYGAYGAAGTAVADAYVAADPIGAMLFASVGDGTNTLLKAAEDLGLGALISDDLDGLAVVEAPPPPAITSASCDLDYDPRDPAEGALAFVGGVMHIGPSVMVIAGQAGTTTSRYIAYDASTCQFLQQKDLPNGFANVYDRTIAPLPGWSAETPLDEVEHFQVGSGGGSPQKALLRADADGTFIDSTPISSVLSTDRVAGLLHEPVTDRIFLLIGLDGPYRGTRLAALPRPDGVLTSLDTPLVNLSMPCTGYTNVTGTDPLGNLYVAQRQAFTAEYRVCGFAPSGELLPSPYFWSPEGPVEDTGFIAGGAAQFLLSGHTLAVGTKSIERGVFEAP